MHNLISIFFRLGIILNNICQKIFPHDKNVNKHNFFTSIIYTSYNLMQYVMSNYLAFDQSTIHAFK